jgi:FMN reductase
MSDPRGDAVRVIGICGSLSPTSRTRAALVYALAGAREWGADTELVDLRDFDLPFCTGSTAPEDDPPDLARFRTLVSEARGIILATPEYHGSMSGVLKNALDLMGFREFEGKMIGLVGVSGGLMGALDALNSLRNVGRALHAWVVPQQASIPNAWEHFDDAGTLVTERYLGRLQEVGRQVARFAYLHSDEGALEFLRAWEEAPRNPGGGAEG